MSNATIVRLVRYVNIFGTVTWLSRDEAGCKLAEERTLYERWSRTPELRDQIQPPRIAS